MYVAPLEPPAIVEPVRRRTVVRARKSAAPVVAPDPRSTRTYVVLERDGRFVLIPLATFEERWECVLWSKVCDD